MQIICRWAYSYTKCQWHTKAINLFNLPRLIGPFASKYKRSTIGSFGPGGAQLNNSEYRIFLNFFRAEADAALGIGIGVGDIVPLATTKQKFELARDLKGRSLSLLGAIKRVGRTHKK